MKKPKHKKKNSKIIFVIMVSIFIIAGYFITIFTHPTFVMYSDSNTTVHIGEVTNVYLESYNTGYKTRKSAKVYIELESRNVFYIPNLTLRENDYDYESLKEIILNNTVEINASEREADKIVSIKCNQQNIFTYDDMNKTQLSNRIGIGIVCIIAIAVIALLKLL